LKPLVHLALALFFQVSAPAAVQITGELKQWHKISLTMDGPTAREGDSDPNPFLDYDLTIEFRHESGSPQYNIPGYFAADGDAANSSAEEGNQWRAHLSPDKPGKWNYRVNFRRGNHAAIEKGVSAPIAPLDGVSGDFLIEPTGKIGRDFRGKGRLEYVGGHFLRFAGNSEYFLKAGADAPESLLAFAHFDGTESNSRGPQRSGEAAPAALHHYEPHLHDWKPGDPTWKNGKGKGLVGALNYLAGTGCNAFSFLTYNVGGDGDNVWPFRAKTDKLHYDCSKLDQWQIVFDHAQALGLYLHFKLQENEMDDNRFGHERQSRSIPSALDSGALGVERKLYLRELIARFGHELALNWNLGEENTQSAEEQRAMAQYIHDTDPYHHHIVVHTFPDEQERVYNELSGNKSILTGASLQNNWNVVHERTLHWLRASAQAGRPWVVANDEQGPADLGAPPDPGYMGFNGTAQSGKTSYTIDDMRKYVLWGNLMAGGAGVEYYFGYKLPQNDLNCEDWRSRDKSWNYGRISLEFFRSQNIPFWRMTGADALIGNPTSDNSRYCLADPGKLYLVYLPNSGTVELQLEKSVTPQRQYSLTWFNPRSGVLTTPAKAPAGAKVRLTAPSTNPAEDWLALIRIVTE
jgi:hypothetical protein